MNADVIIGIDSGTSVLKAGVFALEGVEIDVARECHSDMVPVRGMYTDEERGTDR